MGTKLFDVKRSMIGEEYSLLDLTGNKLGMMRRKLVSIAPSYELYDGNKKLIGRVVQEVNIVVSVLSGPKNYVLEDAEGNKIAHVRVDSPFARIFKGLEEGGD